MIIFLHGKDTFRSRQQMKKMIEKFKADRDPDGYNVVRIDAAAMPEPERIIQELSASPFLAGRRLVAIESLLSSKHADAQTQLREQVEAGKLPETTVALFWEDSDAFKGKAAGALADALLKEKYVQRFDQLTGAKLIAWIREEAADMGGCIDADAAAYLAAHAQGDSWRIRTLLEQLYAYRRGEDIRKKDAQVFLEEKEDDNIFTLVDAVVAGNARSAYGMMREQYRRGEDAQYVFAMLLRQFRILLQIRDAMDRADTLSSDALARAMSLHPFVVKKSLPLVKRHTKAALVAAYRGLLAFDRSVKTGQGRPEVLLDFLVARHAH
jgi:DNA polymerase-3 subunit delta